MIPREHDPLACGIWPSGHKHFSLPLACNSMYIPSGHMQECPLLGRPIHKNGQTGVLELVAQALVPWRKLCEKICKTRGEKKKHCKIGSKTLTSLVNRYLEIHDPWKSTSYGQQSRAAILIGHKDSLCVPVIPIHDVLEDGHGERVQSLVLKAKRSKKFL